MLKLKRLQVLMAREYEHARRFLSRKDPNYVLALGTCRNYVG